MRGVEKDEELEHSKLPDPEGQAIEDLARRLEELEARVRALAGTQPSDAGNA
jgi:hypothetical protein